MAKLLLILFIGLTFESTGVVLLKKGMTRITVSAVSGKQNQHGLIRVFS